MVRIVATMMVRDEIDIVAAMVEHHLAQGIDQLIVTDNASVDGTTEVLQAYATDERVELRHDPVHRKQQSIRVTEMARDARTTYAADWVLNLDADEFLVPVDRSLTIRDALTMTPLALNAFTTPVTNLVGPAAWSGGGVGRLVWRDHRSTAQLEAIGIHAHPTPNAVHRGEVDVTVAQGNHFVSLVSNGQPPDEAAMEVYHLPWRSWAQLERKVVNAGLAYEQNPDLRPSPRHHGMRDYRRYQAGTLQDAYLARTPLITDLESDTEAYTRDNRLAEHLRTLHQSAVRPDLLAAVVDASADDPVPADEHAEGSARGFALLADEPQPPAR